MIRTVGNNGNQLVETLHEEGLLTNGITLESVEELAKPFMINEKHLRGDDFWEDVCDKLNELGYAFVY